MRVVYIITGLEAGGAENMLFKLLERLDRQSYAPTVISLTTAGVVGPRIAALGIPVLALGMKPSLPNPLILWRLWLVLRQTRPDVVQTWMYHADLLGGLVARLAGVNSVVWSIRNSDLSPERNKRSTLLVVRCCAWLSRWLPRRILTCSVRACATHKAFGYHPVRFQLLPNGFDLSRFAPSLVDRDEVRKELGLPADALLVGLIARFDPQKDHVGFIKAARLIHETLPEVHFVLAGSGIDHSNENLSQWISQAGLASCFHLLGQRNDMPRLMAALDVLASSSIGEAFPNVLGEAMACGVPCVVTDAGDSAEIVGDCGRVVPVRDMDALADQVTALLRIPTNERRELGQRARARIENKYEIGRIVSRFEQFYLDLAKA